MSQRNSFPPDFWAPMARLAQACSSLFKGGDGDGDDDDVKGGDVDDDDVEGGDGDDDGSNFRCSRRDVR